MDQRAIADSLYHRPTSEQSMKRTGLPFRFMEATQSCCDRNPDPYRLASGAVGDNHLNSVTQLALELAAVRREGTGDKGDSGQPLSIEFLSQRPRLDPWCPKNLKGCVRTATYGDVRGL